MKVTLGTLKDKGSDLASFLEPRVGAKPSLSGGAIEIDDGTLREGVKPRQVKTYIKRFLYMNGVRKKYRVFVSGKELTIQEIVLGEEKEEEEKEKEEKEEAPKEEATEKEEEEGEKPTAPEPEAPEAEPAKGDVTATEEKPKKPAAKKPRASRKKKTDSS